MNAGFSKAHFTIGRLMRYLSSVGMLEEIAVDTFAATNVTQALANPGQKAGVSRFLLVSLHPISLFPPWRPFSIFLSVIGDLSCRSNGQQAAIILCLPNPLALTLLALCFRRCQAF